MTSEFKDPKVTFLEKLDEIIKAEPEDSPIKKKFSNDIAYDYLKFKALLNYEQTQTQPQPLHPCLSPSDQLVLEVDNDLELGQEEEDDSPDDLTFLKDISNFTSKKNSVFSLNPNPGSKKNSIFSINAPSKKNSIFYANKTGGRHYSFLSEFTKKRDSLIQAFPNNLNPKRSSAISPTALRQFAEEENKKRNSAILEDISLKLVQPSKFLSKKNVFENIKSSSIKCNLSLSSFKSSDQNSHTGYDSGNQELIEEDISSDNSSESESNVSNEEFNEEMKEESYTKISFLKYENKKFIESQFDKEQIANLKKMNLMEDFFEDVKVNEENLDKQDCLFPETSAQKTSKKFNVTDQKYLPYQPYYLLDRQGIVKHNIKRSKGNWCISKRLFPNQAKANTQPDEKNHDISLSGSIVELGTFETDKNNFPYKDSHRFYVTSASTQTHEEETDENNSQAFTMFIKNRGLYSQTLNLNNPKSKFPIAHFQVKSAFHENNQVIGENIPEGYQSLSPTLSNKSALCPSSDIKHYIGDCGSKRGTFIQLEQNNPMLLQEGNLFLLNSKFGFYIKSLEEEVSPQENTIFEVICVNQKNHNQSVESLISPTISSPGLTEKKSLIKTPNSELKDLYLKMMCPGVKLELVRWNERFQYYEEYGNIVVIYNDKGQIGSFEGENESTSSNYNTKNWVNIGEGSKILSKIIKKLHLGKKILMFYDLTLKAWCIETTKEHDESINTLLKDSYLAQPYLDMDPKKDDLNIKIMQGINLIQVHNHTEDELVSLDGLWVCSSQFNILQDQFESEWTRVGTPSLVMFEDIIFKLSQEKILTVYSS